METAGHWERYEPVWRERFRGAEIAFPPEELGLLAFKAEGMLEVWARSGGGTAKIHTFPIFAQSGGPGPKLREGDKQVPEGIYAIGVLNPASRYHLSLGLDYPNAFDWARAREDGRSEPGTHIYIHGGSESVGCLALGDDAIEALYGLVGAVGKEKVRVIIAPNDGRGGSALMGPADPPVWLPQLHAQIRQAWSNW